LASHPGVETMTRKITEPKGKEVMGGGLEKIVNNNEEVIICIPYEILLKRCGTHVARMGVMRLIILVL
jgi:hypothetical protein